MQTQLETLSTAWEDKGSVGAQIGEWLMESEGEGKPTNLQVAALDVGQALYASLRNGAAAVMGGEKRHESMVENRTLEAIENSDPEMKVLKGFFERFGLLDLWNPEDIPAVVKVLQKHGILGGSFSPPSNSTARSMKIE